MKPLEQLVRKMDLEGRIVFQGTIMAGYTPRQALYNAFGVDPNGFYVDTFPEFVYVAYDVLQDQRLAALLHTSKNEDIEEIFWTVWENATE